MYFFCRNDGKYVLYFFMFISDKYMSRVFMHKRKIYLWVLDHRRWNAAPTVLSQSWCELILLWSLVSFNVVVVLYCFDVDAIMSWFFEVDYVRLWVFWSGFFSVFVIDVCFCFVSWRWRWRCVVALFRLCELVWKSWIWFFFFLIKDLGSLVLSLLCWMHISIQHD